MFNFKSNKGSAVLYVVVGILAVVFVAGLVMFIGSFYGWFDETEYEAVVTEPTCTEQGYTTYTATDGSDVYVDDYVDALGHDYVFSETVDPTCTLNGYNLYVCSRCGDEYKGDVVSKLGHDYAYLTVDPTCTEYGYTLVYCTVCDYRYETDIVDAVGHSYEDGVCIYCGLIEPYSLTNAMIESGLSLEFTDGIASSEDLSDLYNDDGYYAITFTIDSDFYSAYRRSVLIAISSDDVDENDYFYVTAAIWVDGEYVTRLCGFDSVDTSESGYADNGYKVLLEFDNYFSSGVSVGTEFTIYITAYEDYTGTVNISFVYPSGSYFSE